MLSLNVPQSRFINAKEPFRAFCGGYRCLREGEEVLTDRGYVSIGDIGFGERVLSYDVKNGRYCYSLTSGGFPKGKANLYRVVSERGEFVASGSHLVFCEGGKYRRVEDLCVGDVLLTSSESQPSTTLGLSLKSLPSNALHCSGTSEGSLYHCEGGCHLCGQQLPLGQDTFQGIVPSLGDVQVLNQPFDQCGFVAFDADDLVGQSPLHSHHDQFSCLQYMSHEACQMQSLGFDVLDYGACNMLEHTFLGNQRLQQFPLTNERHQRVNESDQCHIYFSYNNNLTKTTIVAIEKERKSEWYFDMQVANTHNYMTKGGIIHHNSGKTFVGCVRLWLLALKYPEIKLGYFAPTYQHVRDILFTTIGEVGEALSDNLNVPCGIVINKTEHTVGLIVNGNTYATIKARSMERPETIVGFDINHALIDEIDCMRMDKANLAWTKIIARMSSVREDYPQNTVDFTTTPEGFGWMYNFFVSQLEQKPELKQFYRLVKASTTENAANLPDDYIEKLYATYPSNVVDAYVNGEFVNMSSGTVYSGYNREANRSFETVVSDAGEKEQLFIGMDFNIGKMASVVYVRRGSGGYYWHAVDEIKDEMDTPSMVEEIQRRYPGHRINVYPDASGRNRKSNDASLSDIAILENAGFYIYANPKNPPVRDRVLAANKCFEDKIVRVNDSKCPEFASCLEKQAYNERGEPDKSSGTDHMNDAGTYPLVFEMPIVKPVGNLNIKFAY